jgi:hypothetical protein
MRIHAPRWLRGRLNAVAVHFYATCNQRDVDTTLFDGVLLMSLGTFSSGRSITIDKNTSATSGPAVNFPIN